MARPRSDPKKDIFDRALKDFDEDHAEHERKVQKYDSYYRSYRALLDGKAEAREASYKKHLRPGYVFQAIETMVSNLVDPNPKWRLRVHPQMAAPERLEQLKQGARANELLLRHQLTLDHWPEKQRPFDLQGLICGVTASKQYWNYREGPRPFQRFYEEPVIGPFGENYGMRPRREDVVETQVLRDDPCSEVVDVRHLIFQRGAVSLQRSERLTHRVFYSFEQLKRMECRVAGGKLHEGPCEPGRYYHNVDELKNEEGVQMDRFERENAIFGTRPHRDDIEVLEQWRRDGDTCRVVCIGQRKTLLRNSRSPLWLDHLDHPFPFVVCTGQPDLFAIEGISEVEMMADLQKMLWTLANTRLEGHMIANNAIVLIADDVEDPDAFEFAPGERWLVPRPIKETIDLWSPDVQSLRVSLEAEALIKGDIQNTSGGMPHLSGTQTMGMDQETATGVSIITSLAQKRLAAKRQQFVWAKARIGEQWTALNQQYVREERSVPVIGADGAEAFEAIQPELLQGLFLFETEITDDSLMRQERRAEAQAKFQIAVSSAPVMLASQTPLNLRAFMDDVLDAYDITDKERYYTAQPVQMPPGPGQQQPGAPGNGVTNPALAAGQMSPSNANSMSPEADMARFMSMRGGAANG